MHYQDPQISKLISGHAKGTLNGSEQKELDNWLKDDANRQVFEKALKKEEILAKSFEYDHYQTEMVWDRIDKKLFGKNIYLQWAKYAAAIIIPLILGLGIFLLSDTDQPEYAQETILPVVKKATLFLSDGSTQALDENTITTILEGDGQVVGVDSSNTLAYVGVKTKELIYNTLKVPYGGEYNLKLSDGTKVWLNSGSELRYPIDFVGDKREIFLKGEGYFDVAHNSEKPFLVHTDHSVVQVYGTRFNVMSYANDNNEQVTLVEGKVGFSINGKQTLLEPGQQAELNLKNDEVSVKAVDTSYYTGWVDGTMKFKNLSIRELSKRIARWYDVDFFFANTTVAEFGFSGKFDRDCDFELLMDLLERTTNVQIEVKGRTVIVKEIK